MSAFSSSSRSASGAAKGRFQQQNINSVFASKGTSASKASGPSKHGLQSLGKQTAAVRRMPPPATLPSLRAESAGQDPAVALVPQGGTGWGTQTQSADSAKSAVDSSVNGSAKLEQDQRNAAQGALSGRAGSSPSAGGPDLRPTWAKADQTPNTATNTRDFPTLSAAATKTTPIPEGAGSLKPQKSGSWKAGGGSALSKSEQENQQNQSSQEQKQLRGESGTEEQTGSGRASIDRDSPHTASGGAGDHLPASAARPYLSSTNPPNRGPPVPPPARYYGGGGGGYGGGGGGPTPYSQPPSHHHQQQPSKPPHGYGQQSNYGGGGMPPIHGSSQAPPSRSYGSQDARYQQSQSPPQNQNSVYPPPQRSSMYDGPPGGGPYGPPPMASSRPGGYDVMPPPESPPISSSSSRGDYPPNNQQGGYGPPHGGYVRRPMPPPIAENDENYDDVDDYHGPYRRSDEPRVMWSDDEDMGPPRGRGPPPHPPVRYHDDRYDGPPPMGPPPSSGDWYAQPPMRPGGHPDGGPGPYGPPMPPQRGGPPPSSGGWYGGPPGPGPQRGGPPMGYGPGPQQQQPMDRRSGGPPMPPMPPPQQQQQQSQHQRFGNYQPAPMPGNRMVVDVDKEDADEEHRQMQQTMEREAAIERSRQKRRLAQQGSIPSEGEYGPIGSGPPMRATDPFDQPPNENDRPSSRDSYGRSHGAKRELPPRLQQKQKDRAAAAAGGGFDDAAGKGGGDRRWDARGGAEYADVNGGGGTAGGKSRRRVKQPRKDADERMAPEVRLLKRPDSKESASSAEVDIGRSSSDRSMTVDASRRTAQTYEEDEEDLNLTKLSRPAARVIKRVAPNTQQANADKDGGKGQQQTQQKPPREKQRSTAPQSQTAASLDSKGDAKQSEDSMALSPEFKEAPPPAENIWEKRMEERESAEREKQVAAGFDADADYHDQQMPQRRQQFQQQQQQGHGMNPRDPHAQTRRPTKEEWQAGAPTAPQPTFRGNREFVNSRRTRGASVTAVGGGRGRARGGVMGAMRRGGSLPHRHHQPHGHPHQQHQHIDLNGGSPSMGLNQDNFANMGEFHADANGSLIEGDAPSVVAMPTDNGVVDVDDEQDQEQDGVAKRGGMTAGGVGRSGGRAAPGRGGAGRPGRYQPYIDQNVYTYSQDGQYQSQQPPTNGTYGRGRGGSTIGQQRTSRGGGMTASGHGGRSADPRNGGSYVARRGGDGTRGSHPHERGKRKKNDDEGGDVAAGHEEGAMAAGHREQRRGGVHRTRASGVRQRRSSGGRQDPNQGGVPGHPASAKSPVASEGYDEWETASESSDIGSRRHSKDMLSNQEINGNGNRKSTQPRFSQQRRERPPRGAALRPPKDGAKSPSASADGAEKGANPKNAKPASHHQGNQPNASTKRRGELLEDSIDANACKNTDGLAGFDINNAGVIVIDDQPDVEGHSERGFDDFEEVLSKKEKRARQQRLQELQEKEEKRRLRERERQEKLQQKKRNHEKHQAEKRAAAAAAAAAAVAESATPATITVWNSATAGGNGAAERKLSGTADAKKAPLVDQATVPTMPSPIARPTPRNKQAGTATTAVVLPSTGDMSGSQAATTTIPSGNSSKTGVEIWGSPDVASFGADVGGAQSAHVDEMGRPTPAKSVEFPASFGSPPELDASDKFDFTFDPNLPTNDSSTRQSPILGPVGDIPAPTNGAKLTASSSLGDQQQLKEKLDKVKDFWPGGDEASIVSSAASLLVSQQLGSSVVVEASPAAAAAAAAKGSLAEGPHVAKVRPQPQTNETGVSSASATAFHPHHQQQQQQPSKPTPPAGAIGAYSICLPGMAPPPAPFQLTTSSPPTFSLQPQQPQGPIGGPMQRSPFDHPQMFAHPPPSAMPWSTGGGQMDMLAGLGAPTQPPQGIPGQQQQRQQPPPPPGIGFQQTSAAQQQPATYGLPPPSSSLKTPMAGGFGPLMSAPPPDFVNVAQPPPMLGAVGSQRAQTRPQMPTQLQLGAIGSQAFTGYMPPSAPTSQHQPPPTSFVAPPPPALGQPRFAGPPPTLGALDLNQAMGAPPPMFAKPQGPAAGWNGPPPPSKSAVVGGGGNFGPFGSMKFGGFAQQMTTSSANQRPGPASIQPMTSSSVNQRASGPAPIQRPMNQSQALPTRRPPSAHLHHDGGKEGSDLLLQQSIDRFISDGGDEQQAKKIGH